MPLIPLSDVVGNADKIAPEQIGATALNAGVTAAPIVATVILNGVIHPLASFTVIIYGPAARFKKILLV